MGRMGQISHQQYLTMVLIDQGEVMLLQILWLVLIYYRRGRGGRGTYGTQLGMGMRHPIHLHTLPMGEVE